MRKIVIGIVDYHIGNYASVIHTLRELNFRVLVSDDKEILNKVDVLLLPGVGAFPSVMKSLYDRDLVTYLQGQARLHRPIVGICLGMQLLAEGSNEHQYTAGLGLIPGEVVSLSDPKWHIGWNTLECIQKDVIMQPSDGKAFYFNHSFIYNGPVEYRVCLSKHHKKFPSVIRRGSVMGVQFHPEKSQASGRELLQNLITGICNA